MKRSWIAVLVLGAAIIAGSALAVAAAAPASENEKAVVVFNEKVKLVDVLLQGQYLFVHDDGKMAEGLPCLYVYQQEKGQADKLVVSFHCIPVQRRMVDSFRIIISSNNTAFGVDEIEEIQFAGSEKAHRVPSDRH
ncbi:MAG TPA: hypothetical protein VLD57_00685 [Blastocatellia bacterium]|nr:hypothetical protein [Blastocatellia bacterium]